jgi:hypothetical protein
MRRLAGLAAQRVALLDSESMLLVDDHESEIGELNLILDKCVGSDDDAGGTARRVE